jgi:hypothetical protein
MGERGELTGLVRDRKLYDEINRQHFGGRLPPFPEPNRAAVKWIDSRGRAIKPSSRTEIAERGKVIEMFMGVKNVGGRNLYGLEVYDSSVSREDAARPWGHERHARSTVATFSHPRGIKQRRRRFVPRLLLGSLKIGSRKMFWVRRKLTGFEGPGPAVRVMESFA